MGVRHECILILSLWCGSRTRSRGEGGGGGDGSLNNFGREDVAVYGRNSKKGLGCSIGFFNPDALRENSYNYFEFAPKKTSASVTLNTRKAKLLTDNRPPARALGVFQTTHSLFTQYSCKFTTHVSYDESARILK